MKMDRDWAIAVLDRNHICTSHFQPMLYLTVNGWSGFRCTKCHDEYEDNEKPLISKAIAVLKEKE